MIAQEKAAALALLNYWERQGADVAEGPAAVLAYVRDLERRVERAERSVAQHDEVLAFNRTQAKTNESAARAAGYSLGYRDGRLGVLSAYPREDEQ